MREQGLGLTRLPRRLATRLLPRGEQHLLPADAHGPSRRGLPLTRGPPPPRTAGQWRPCVTQRAPRVTTLPEGGLGTG